jgi:small subunit ribosomal protein S13
MARIAGIDLKKDKKIGIALTYIFGIGTSTAVRILQVTNIDPNKRTKDLTAEEVNRLREIIEKEYKVEGDLRSEVSQNIKRLMEINSYRGSRHRKNLPVRGQRTRTNARTHKGPRIAVGGLSKKAVAKK